jgi:DNA-binding IclR family transcriptional regulator
MPSGKKKYYQIASLEKGVKILELLAEQKALTVTEVASALTINRAGSHRFLATLRDLGYVEKNEENRYQLTFRIFEMGMKVADRSDIRQEAHNYMREISVIFRETVNLGFWDGKDILHLDKIDSLEILRIDAPLGSKTPAYCTALGKAILAHLSPKELSAYLSRTRLVPHGPNTIVSKKKFREELKKIRQQGYALDDEELAEGLRCIAAPIFDYTGQSRYALSISSPTMRLPMDKVDKTHQKVREVCNRLSPHLGYQPTSLSEQYSFKEG